MILQLTVTAAGVELGLQHVSFPLLEGIAAVGVVLTAENLWALALITFLQFQYFSH